MSTNQQQRFIRAGIAMMTIVLTIAVLIIVGSLSWIGWKYFSKPSQVTEQTKNNNTVVTSTTIVPHTVQGFFQAISDSWRPNTKTYAMSNGRTLTEYPYDLPAGPLAGATVTDEPIPTEGTTNTNTSTNDNTNSVPSSNSNNGTNTNESNVNQAINTNREVNTNTVNNTNVSGNINTNTATNGNTNGNANANMNVNQSDDLNVNSVLNNNQPVNLNTGGETNSSTNQNTNTPIISTNTNVATNNNLNIPTNSEITTNSGTSNTNTSTSIVPTVVTAEDWYRQVPNGKAFIKVNWFCSAALTHLTDITRGPDQLVGDFTGDCTNPNVSVKGNFVPLAIGEFTPAKHLTFTVASEHQFLGNISHQTSDTGACTFDYLQNAGMPGLYAAQFTCDDGYGVGHDDIQFAVYIFPDSWQTPANPIDLLITADQNSDDDGDGMTYVQEIFAGTNPNNSDSDYDGLGDFEEINKYLTKPMVADTDGDGFKDGEEIAGGYNPLGQGKATAEQLQAWGSAPSQAGKTVISDTAATYASGQINVTWSVKPDADGIINWGPTATYGQHLSDYAFSASHVISFAATAGQTVHYAIRSCTPAPTAICTVSSDLVFDVPK